MESQEQPESGVTMTDYLTDMLKEEEIMKNILAKDETKECTYTKGYSTQTVFGCRTCGAQGGMCLACYLNCHLDHDTFEIGLKRNFRCDCGTDKFNNHPCTMAGDIDKTEGNIENKYDHNFQARFCKCNAAYDINQFMIRCLHCLDFFHLFHLGLPEEIQAIVEGNDDFTQMICSDCVDKNYRFLQLYKKEDIFYTEEELRATLSEEDNKNSKLEKKLSDTPVVLGKRTRSLEEDCLIKEKYRDLDNNDEKRSLFMKENWNNNLCYCDDCIKMYKENKVYDVLTEEVVNAESWQQPQIQEAETKTETTNNTDLNKDDSLYNQAMQELTKLDFMTQSRIATVYRDFYDEFKEFFEKFKDKNAIVKQDDIQEFFTYLKTKQNDIVI